jgi:hypothetical protein
VRHGIRELATWAFLVAYLLTAVAPIQGLVLCLEPDGTVAIETAADADGCEPCGGGSSEPEGVWVAGCPCVDIPLPSRSGEPEAKPKAGDLAQVPSAAVPAASLPAAAFGLARGSLAARALPRPPPGLALIQTVVLRV